MIGRTEFGPFSLDLVNRRVLRPGTDIHLRPQAFLVLELLVRKAGQYISHAEMSADAWGCTAVERHTVVETIRAVKAALQEYGSWVMQKPRLGYVLRIPSNEEQIRKGWHCWSRRSREGFEMALAAFEDAARMDPNDFQAYIGLGLSYLMLGTYGMMEPRRCYVSFLTSHDRAVELAGWTPELRTDYAHGRHIFEGRVAEAEEQLIMARTVKPRLVTVYVSLSMLYASVGRFPEALEALDAAYSADCLWPTLPALKAFVHFCAGDFKSAVRHGKEAIELHPYVHLGRCYYAQGLEYNGDPEEALAQYDRTWVVTPDIPWLLALKGSCLARMGKIAEASAIESELSNQREQQRYVDAYYMAVLLEAMGRRKECLVELERAVYENSATLFIIDVDPKLDSLRVDPAFVRLRERLAKNRSFPK